MAGADGFRLEGHGGPVMDIAVAPTNGWIATASFDNALGLWTATSPRWLDGHEAAVNRVMFVDDGHAISASDDFAVRFWTLESGESQVLYRHRGKVMGLAQSSDHHWIASASWDGTVGLHSTGLGGVYFLEDHEGPVNSVAFSEDGEQLYSASADGTIRVWDLADTGASRVILRAGFGINRIVLGPGDAWLAYGTVDGVTRVVDPATGDQIADFTLDRRPILALATTPGTLAVGDGEGYIMLIDTSDWSVDRDIRVTDRGPVWSIAFANGGQTLLAAGLDPVAYAWPLAEMGRDTKMAAVDPSFLKDPELMGNGERQFQRKCSICHTLTPGSARRAGPTLHAIFGRPAGAVADYIYSDALDGSDIIWDETTIDALFDEGPDVYVPGTKMPVQRITGAQDRRDLIAFLREATQ